MRVPRERFCLLIFVLLVLATSVAQGQKPLTTAEAKNHVGESTTICGEVVSIHFAARSRGNPTFLNLDKPYPNQVFTVVIWGSDRSKFGKPDEVYSNKHICVTGKISTYRGVPEVTAHDPSQIKSQ